MRKIKLLLVAVFALIGMSAFADMPKSNDVGYIYNPAKGVFLNDKVAADFTGVIYNFVNEGTSRTEAQGFVEDPATAEMVYTYLRFEANKEKSGRLSVSATGLQHKNEYAIWACRETKDGVLIRCVYQHSQRNWIESTVPCGLYLALDADNKLILSETKTYWQFVDEDRYKQLTAGSKTIPANNAVGYLFNPMAGKFITKNATLAETGDPVKVINEGASGDFTALRFEFSSGNRLNFNGSAGMQGTGTNYAKFLTKSTDRGIIMTHSYPNPDNPAWMKTNNLGGTYMFANGEQLWFKQLAELDGYGYWTFLDQDAYNALMGPAAPKKFPEEGAEGYLYNAASGMFITKDAHLAKVGDKITVVAAGTSGDFVNVRYQFSAGNQLNFNGASGMQGTGTSYSKFSVKITEKGIIMTHAYPNPDNPAWTKEKNLGGTYMIADGNELGFAKLEDLDDYGYWQFVDQETYEKLVSTPVYYLKNAESGLFFGGENNWGTRGTLSARGDLFKLVKLADGEYAIQNTLVSINDNKLGSNIYVDNAGAKGGWTITNVGDGKYTIYNAEVASGGYLAQGTEQLARGYAAVGVADVKDAAKWYILTKEEAVAQMGTATVENPLPATFLIKNPGFNRNYSTADWKMEASNQNLSGGTNDNRCAESYHAEFTLSQAIEGVPNGVYVLTAQGFYRQDGGNNDDLPVFYGNQMTGKFPLKTGTENSMNDASGSFDKGLYTIDPIYVQVTNNKLTVGAKLAGNTSLWCIWDNFQLSYIGNADAANEIAVNAGKKLFDDVVAEAKALATAEMNEELRGDLKELIAEIEGETFTTQRGYVLEAEYVLEAIQDAKASAAIYADYRAAIAAARAIFPETMPADKLVALDKAIKDYPESKVLVDGATDASINEAATAIWAAYNDAANFVNSGSALMGMYELMEHNNVVTPKAYETYFNKFEALSKQWQAGTLAEAVVNPYNLNGWHANLDYDDYLLSTWTVGGEQAQNYDKALYINTWSTEGEGDGTDFKVPFFEYWTGDANSLGKNELVATLNDIEPGIYEVSAWVRVRAKNGTQAADATGITLQLNDGDAVDVTEGDAVGQFNLAEYVAEGEVEEGTLKVKFTVAEGNNISWLSFQNVKYTKTGDIATAISEVGNKATAKTIFNVAGQQMNGLQKGLNIVDGKKVYIK